MKVKEDWLWNISIILVNAFIFFGYLFTSASTFMVVCSLYTMVVYLFFYKKINLKVIKSNLVWIMLLIYFSIGILGNDNVKFSLKFIITFFSALIIKIIYTMLSIYYTNYNWRKKFLDIAFIFSRNSCDCNFFNYN